MEESDDLDNMKIRMNKVVRRNLRVRLGDVVSLRQDPVVGLRSLARAL